LGRVVSLKTGENSGQVRFGEDFEFDSRAYRLSRSSTAIKLERIPMEILAVLVEARGELVTREQIAERVWGKGVFLDTDNSINGAIRKIRQVLKDDPNEPRYIQTITGKGYRFIAPVTQSESAAAPSGPPSDLLSLPVSLPISLPDESVAAKSSSRGWVASSWMAWLAIASIGLILAVLGVRFQWSHSSTPSEAPSGRQMLAVLPFANLTGDAGQDYFSDGLTEEMISQLGNLDPTHLGVIARTSVMHYKRTVEPLDRIGKELGVQYVLEGSVRRDSSKVRITAQLIQVKDQSHLWARQYDRDLSNLLTLQGEIAQQVATEIQITLGESKQMDSARQTPLTLQGYEGYDLYLKGRYFWNKRTSQGLQQAIECFHQAIAKDPKSARAYSGLADSYALLSGYSGTPQGESMPKARDAALKALELDDGLAEAHTSLALITENYDWDWTRAEKEYLRAIELNPNYATAHHWYAEYLSLQGRFDEAFAESERARQLDPLSLIISADNGEILYYSRQYDRAIVKLRGVQEMEPKFPRGHIITAPYVEKGQYDEALSDIQTWEESEDSSWKLAWLVYVYGRSGQSEKAQRSLVSLQRLYRTLKLGPDPMVWAYLGVGDRDKAFVWLEKAYVTHSNLITTLKVEPGFDSLRSDGRFQDLMRRVKLIQ
jgi:TolB-like protein/DNA-binding winged helix-turn-helix (wHTH) protein/Tfp pilus assembly protein PilF